MSITATLKEIQQKHEALKVQIKEMGTEAIKEFSKEVFESIPTLNKFVVQGYTPAFNDGEPCEHHAEVFWGDYVVRTWSYSEGYCIYGDDECGGYEEFFELEESEVVQEDTIPQYANTGCSLTEGEESLLNSVIVLLDEVYTTDYEVFFERGKDPVHEEYDCGY